jgi:hypothetical protein
MKAIPVQLRIDILSPRNTTPNIASSATLILSTDATADAF